MGTFWNLIAKVLLVALVIFLFLWLVVPWLGVDVMLVVWSLLLAILFQGLKALSGQNCSGG